MNTDLEKIGTDPVAVTEAMRRLLEASVAEDTALINRAGHWPEDVQNSLAVAAITHPISFACRKAADVMLAHLATLIGREAAETQFNALIADLGAQPEVRASLKKVERASGKAASSSLRSVH